MSSAIMSLLISHVLTFVEGELAKNEPALIAALEADVNSLIAKLESMLSTKSPSVAKVVNPVLTSVSEIASDAVEAAGTAVANDVVSPVAANY
jgi:hypothetical protein